MKFTILGCLAVLVAIGTTGCATQAPVVPSLSGHQRVPINKTIPAKPPLVSPAPAASTFSADQED